MARTLTDPVDGFLRTTRYLIHDRDPLYTRVVTDILTSGAVQPIRLPPKSPNLNAHTPNGLFGRSRRNVSLVWSRLVRATCASSRGSTLSTTTASATIKDSTTGFCSKRHRRSAGPPTCGGATAWADSSISTIEKPRDWSAH